MANPNLAAIVADAWDMVATLSGYGHEPLTVGWWRGHAYVKIWNYRRGEFEWKRFRTNRPEQPNPNRTPFSWDHAFSNERLLDRLPKRR